MIYKLKHIAFLLLPLWMFFSKSNQLESNHNIEIDHVVTVEHPGEALPVETILTEIKNRDSITIGYAMDVKSVICLEEVCKVIPVRLYWNDIGVYQKYVLAKEATLEKYEADVFAPEDYKKLHSVLANENSPFKDVLIHEVLTVVEHGDEDVDAVSGATALELDEKDTVPGAALTCYTLWHWAHGDIITTIKKQTGESSNKQRLLEFLTKNNKNYYPVALDALANKNNYASKFVEIVVNKASQNEDLIKPSITYLEKAPIEIYKTGLKEIFVNGNKLQRIAVLRSLQYSKKDISTSYLNTFSDLIKHLKSFQEISVFLGLMEEKNPNSSEIANALVPLLEGDFLIARRVYWFLSESKLTNLQKEATDSFYQKFKDKL